MSVVLLLLFGLVVGWLAHWLMPGRQPGGWMVSMVLGALGSLVGAFLGGLSGAYREGDTAALLVSVFGAFVCVLPYQAVVWKRNVVRSR
jgi:uncharacterized membrane protein YeaQ/YmgE (transglycosylase-associated protein family)